MKKRAISILFAICICMTLLPTPALATSKTADEAIAWAQSKVGQAIDVDGAYGAQCVDLIMAYYEYLGASRPWGNAVDYTGNALPSGWQRIWGAQPQKGDILIYGANGAFSSWGHVAIYESDYVSYHQNYSYVQYVQRITSYYNFRGSGYWGVIRPNFSTASKIPAYSTSQNVTPGKYTLTNVGSGKMMNYAWGVGAYYNPIVLYAKDGSPEQTFNIQHKGNGQYALMIQHSDGGCVNVFREADRAAQLNDGLTRWPSYTGETHHRFYFTKMSDGSYIIRPSSNTSLVVGVSSTNKNMTYPYLTLCNYSADNPMIRWKLTRVES